MSGGVALGLLAGILLRIGVIWRRRVKQPPVPLGSDRHFAFQGLTQAQLDLLVAHPDAPTHDPELLCDWLAQATGSSITGRDLLSNDLIVAIPDHPNG